MKQILFLVIALATIAATGSARADNGNCPPGLAKKSVPCVPPGLAKKGVRHFAPGDDFGGYDTHWISYPDRYALPPLAPGERYVIIGNQILRVDEGTAQVIEFVRLVEAILD